MAIQFNLKSGACSSQDSCLSKDGCPPNVCPDFVIRRHDTRPPFKVSVEDCGGPIDLQGLVVEVSMWALGKLKAAMTDSDTYFAMADNIGFNQVMMGDIIVMDRARNPEHMLVTGFDETNYLIRVQRAYHGTTASPWKKGTEMRIFRIMGAPADGSVEFADIQEVDGTVTKNVLQSSILSYNWQPEDTCLSGCYWLEFKVLKMIDTVWFLPGGYWTGDTFTNIDGFFYTGDTLTDSSAKVYYDQIIDKYSLTNSVWSGPIHMWSDANYYTGTSHDAGSVLLKKSGLTSGESVSSDATTKWYVAAVEWTAQYFENIDNQFYTGGTFTDSSVKLMYSDGNYYTIFSEWIGPKHLFESNWYTGTTHDSGSALIEKIFVDDDFSLGMTSIIPSFTDISLTPADYGCILGEGVEWVRRFPIDRSEEHTSELQSH